MKKLFNNSLQLTGIIGLFIILSIVLCFLLSTSEPSKIIINEPAQEFEVTWYHKESGQEVTLPVPVKGTAGDPITLSTTLPEITSDNLTMMLFSCNSTIQVFINNYKVYSFGEVSNTICRRMVGDLRCIIPIEKSYSGKTLTIIYTPTVPYNGTVPKIYFRNYDSQILDIIKHNYFYLITATVLGVFVINALYLGIYHKRNDMGRNGALFINFALFAFSSQLWIITNSDLAQFLTNFSELTCLICYFSIAYLPVPFLSLTQELLPDNRKLFLSLQHTGMCLVIIEIIGYMTGLLLPSSLYTVITIYYVICMALIFICWIKRLISRKSSVDYIDVGGIFLLLVGALSLILGIVKSGTNWNVFLFSLSVIIFSITLYKTIFFYEAKALKAGLTDEEIDEQSYIDSITKTGNKLAFNSQIDELKKQPSTTSIVLLVAKLTNLQSIDERLGNTNVDVTLQLAAKCISLAFAGKGSLYRIKSDEFVVLFVDTVKSPSSLKERLLNVIAVNNTTCPTRLEMNVGVASGEVTSDPATSINELLKTARSTF